LKRKESHFFSENALEMAPSGISAAGDTLRSRLWAALEWVGWEDLHKFFNFRPIFGPMLAVILPPFPNTKSGNKN
jgi:hypothetical protein